MSDDGLPAAVIERVREAMYAHREGGLTCYDHEGECCVCRVAHGLTDDSMRLHRAEAVARAAREDYGDLVASVAALRAGVAETVREASERAWDDGRDSGWDERGDVQPGDGGRDANPFRAAAIRAGEA